MCAAVLSNGVVPGVNAGGRCEMCQITRSTLSASTVMPDEKLGLTVLGICLYRCPERLEP